MWQSVKFINLKNKSLFMAAFKYNRKVPRVIVKPDKDNLTGDFVSLPDRTMKIRVRVR